MTPTVCLSFAFALLPPPQDPTEALARFELAGKPALVTRADVAVEMAFSQRRKDIGLQAVDVLVDGLVAKKLATAKKLMPTDAEVRKFWADLQAELRAAGQKPEELAAVKNGSEDELLRLLAVQLAQERLVRAELSLPPEEKVSGDMLRLWQQEARKKTNVVTDPDQLPLGTAARVDGEDVPMAELGMLLLRTSDDHDKSEYIHRVAYLQALDALAQQHGIDPTPADLEAAYDKRAAEAARDPRFRGLSFEQLLKVQGLTPTMLRQSRVFRSTVVLQQLVRKLHPDDALRTELQKDRQAILELVGPRRRISMIFVRALDEPNALVPLDFPAALKKLGEVRERLQKDAFDVVARIESQEPASKAKGGDLGWHTRRSDRLPETVLSAAFGLPQGEVSQPLRDRDGCFLVKVTDVEPDLTDEQLLDRLREQRSTELSQKVLTDTKLEILEPKGRSSGAEKGR